MKANQKRDANYLAYVAQTIDYKTIPLETELIFDQAYARLDTVKQRERKSQQPVLYPLGYKKRRPALRCVLTSLSAILIFVVALFTFNFVNPVYAEGLPLVGPLFKEFNSIFRDINSQAMTPTGTNLDTYETENQGVWMTAAEDTDYRIQVLESYSDGTYAHLSLLLYLPEGESTYESIWTQGEATVNGEVCANGLYLDARFAHFFPTEQDGVFAGTVSVALPVMTDGETFDLELTLSGFTGVLPVDLTMSVPDFRETISLTVTEENNRDFDVEAESEGYQLYHVSITPSHTVLTVDVPMIPGRVSEPDTMVPASAVLRTEDGTKLSYSPIYEPEEEHFTYSDRIPTAEDNKRIQIAFDGIPAGTTSLTLQWYPLWYHHEEILAEFTIDLISQTATETTYYQDESSLFYIHNPALFRRGNWNSTGEYVTDWDYYVEVDAIQREQDIQFRIQETADFQNGLGLGELYVSSSDEEQAIGVKIFEENGYRQVEIQYYANDILLGSNRPSDVVLKEDIDRVGYYDQRNEDFAQDENATTPYYFSAIRLDAGTLTAENTSFTVKVIDLTTGETLMETAVNDVVYQW